MTRARRVKSPPACVICGSRDNVQHHHIGGRNHIVWLTAPLCVRHHNCLHLLLESARVDLEYTTNRCERLIRALKAISIFVCFILESLDEDQIANP